MKRITSFVWLWISLAISSLAFGQQTSVVMSFEHLAAGERLTPNSSVFPIWNGKQVRLFRAAFYIAEIELHKTDGSRLMLTDQYLLVDAAEPGREFDLGNWSVTDIEGVSLHIGVDSARNHLDPASYPADHPLAPQNPSMHWGWVSGYRFMAIEGRIDNNADGVPEAPMEFHNLGNHLYTSVYVPAQLSAVDGELRLAFVVEYARLFDQMPLQANLVNHGSFPANQQMMQNAGSQGFITHSLLNNDEPPAVAQASMVLAPNPATDVVQLSYDFSGLTSAADCSLQLIDAEGRTVRIINQLPATGSWQLERGGLAAGRYQLLLFQPGVSSKPLATAALLFQ